MNPTVVLSRKKFIKTLGISTAFSAIGGQSWREVVASEIHALAGTTGILNVRISAFTALQGASGSVRLAINTFTQNGPLGTYYPVIVNKSANNFFAVSSQCTHEGCVVAKMINSTMTCPCHGSVYALDGTRVTGPALSNLTKYTSTFDGADLLKIQIPGLAYSVTVSAVQPVTAGTQRIQLRFSALRNTTYEVQYRETLSSAPVSVLFATTATGPATLAIFKPTVAGTQNFYVDSSTLSGFYTVAIRAPNS